MCRIVPCTKSHLSWNIHHRQTDRQTNKWIGNQTIAYLTIILGHICYWKMCQYPLNMDMHILDIWLWHCSYFVRCWPWNLLLEQQSPRHGYRGQCLKSRCDAIADVISTKATFSEIFMMTSSNGNIFRVTGHLCGEFAGPRWFPHTKASNVELWCFSLVCARINGWVNTGPAGDLRRHRPIMASL